MKQKISQRTLAMLASNGKRHFIRDTDLIGFGIEVSAKGLAKYFVETRVKGTGKTRRVQIGNVDHLPLEDARLEARALLLKAKQGNDIRFLDQEEILPDTLGKALEEFEAAKKHTLAQSTLIDYRATFKNCLSDWKDLPTAQLSKKMVQERYLRLLSAKKPAYVNKVFRNLSAILTFSGLSPNPCSILKEKGLRVPVEGKSRFLSGSEIYTIMQHHFFYKDRISAMVLFYMLTGARRNELLQLKWGNIYDGKIWFGNANKAKRTHTIPFSGMLPLLAGERQADEMQVFPYTENSLRTAFDKFKRAVSFKEDWTIHDLRRTFSEHLNLCGYTENEIAVGNNHAAHSVTSRHYLRGQLAKESLLKRMYSDLQAQFNYYYYDHGGEVQKVPEGWQPEGEDVDLTPSPEEIEELTQRGGKKEF